MSTLRAFVRVSSAKQRMSGPQLEDQLSTSSHLNLQNGITGVLPCKSGSLMQDIEGEADAVGDIHGRIRGSIRHHNIIELVDSPIDHRNFDAGHRSFKRPMESPTDARMRGWRANRCSCSTWPSWG